MSVGDVQIANEGELNNKVITQIVTSKVACRNCHIEMLVREAGRQGIVDLLCPNCTILAQSN